MRSIKAIVAGSVFVIVVVLLLQLAYIFIAVGYHALAERYSIPDEVTGLFRYLVGLPVFLLILFAGGYITASVAGMRSASRVWMHCLAVGLLTVGGTMYFALENARLTLTGVVVIVLAVSAASAGGLYWLKRSGLSDNDDA